jgi:hypothetical protein
MWTGEKCDVRPHELDVAQEDSCFRVVPELELPYSDSTSPTAK